MNSINDFFPLYLITGRFGRSFPDFHEILRSCIEVGARLVQIREKNASIRDFLSFSKEVSRLKDDFDFTLFINDRFDVALLSHADGVHVGQDDIPPVDIKSFSRKLLVGISTHNAYQFEEAAGTEVDYIAVGPIFETKTKPEYMPVGIEFLKSVRKKTKKPIVAIGGINRENFLRVMEAGADSVAVCSDIFKSENPGKIVLEYLEALEREGFLKG